CSAEPRAIRARRRYRFRRLEQWGVDVVAVVVGQRHDDGLVDHIRRVGVALQKVGDLAGVEASVFGAVVGGLVLFCRVGGGNVIGQGRVAAGGRSWAPV